MSLSPENRDHYQRIFDKYVNNVSPQSTQVDSEVQIKLRRRYVNNMRIGEHGIVTSSQDGEPLNLYPEEKESV